MSKKILLPHDSHCFYSFVRRPAKPVMKIISVIIYTRGDFPDNGFYFFHDRIVLIRVV